MKDYREAEMLRAEQDAARDALHFSKARVDREIHSEQGQNMMNLLVDLRTRVDTLVLCVQAAINSGFPMRAVDNLFTVEEPF